MASIAVSDAMLDIGRAVPIDESIESFEYREYTPQDTKDLNGGGTIRIDIPAESASFVNPSKSFLLVEGTLTKAADGSVYAAGAPVSLVNNAVAFMFSRIQYSINDKEIENIMTPGQATTMKGMLTYGDDFAKAEGLNLCWQKDTTANAEDDNLGFAARRRLVVSKPVPHGTFSFCVPLKHLLGFCDDYDKVLYSIKQTLELSRGKNSAAIFHAPGADATDTAALNGQVTLTKLTWRMPYVIPNLEYRNTLKQQVINKVRIPISFRGMQCVSAAIPETTEHTWKLGVPTKTPRWILVAFQTDRRDNQLRNPALFDHVQVRNIYADINGRFYPNNGIKINFTQMKTSLAYKVLRDFKEEYYEIDARESSNQVTPLEFVDLFPIFVIDVRRYAAAEEDQPQAKALHIMLEFAANVPAATLGYAVVISEKLLYLESDGSQFNFVK